MDKHVIRSSILLQLRSGIIYGALGGVLWGLPAEKYYFLVEQGEYNWFSLWLHYPFSWPVCVVTGIIIGIIISCFFRISIIIANREVQVRGFMNRLSYPLYQAAIQYETKKKEHIVWIMKLVFVKRYFSIRISDSEEKTIRLYYFSEQKMAALATVLNAKRTANIPITERAAQKEESLAGGTGSTIQISRERLLYAEKRRIKLTFFLFLGLAAALSLIIIWGWAKSGEQSFKVFFCLGILIFMLMMLSIEIIRFIKYQNHMPAIITYMTNHLLVDSEYYAFSEVVSISLTDPLMQSSSVFPVQRYMIITTLNGQRKYWLGTENGIGSGEYKKICTLLEEAFIYTPEKIRFNSKRSIMTK